MFLTTHYMEEAERVAQRTAVIDHSKIVAQGSDGALLCAGSYLFSRIQL